MSYPFLRGAAFVLNGIAIGVSIGMLLFPSPSRTEEYLAPTLLCLGAAQFLIMHGKVK